MCEVASFKAGLNGNWSRLFLSEHKRIFHRAKQRSMQVEFLRDQEYD